MNLVRHQEGHFFDRKSIKVDGRGIQKIATAFANADGGEFVIGIKDEKEEKDESKRWEGSTNIENFNSVLQALGEVTPSLDYGVTFFGCDSLPGYILSVRVEKTASVHQTSDKTVYVRLGAQSVPLKDADRIIALGYAKGSASFEDSISQDVSAEQVVESETLDEFLSEFSPKSDPLEFVINENLIDRNTWKPRVAAVLLFAKNPTALLSKKCAIKIVRYETREDEPERDHLKYVHTIEGPLYKLIHEAVDRIKEIMSSVAIWTTEGLRTLDYPPESVWEILVNAVIHRDYSISDDIQVQIYNDRIEIISPGKLPGYVTVENILDARYSRNTKIVRTLSRYKKAPNHDLGEGLNTAFQKMKDWKLQPPKIQVHGNYVHVTLPHTPLAKPSELILEFLKTNDTISNSQARELTGIRSENSVKSEFYKLRDAKLLEMVPGLKGTAAAWRLTDEGKRQIVN